MQLRAFRPADLQTLFEIDAACFPPGISYSLQELAGFISGRGSETWVAEAEGGIAGFLIAARAPGKMMQIVTIDVRENWRRRGVGAALMDAAEQWGREQGCEGARLQTGEGNRAAQAFYRARGYVKLGEISRYYSDGSTAWVMGKALKK
jgi:ribosomal protein S18 acetylase RimI-like enzyme